MEKSKTIGCFIAAVSTLAIYISIHATNLCDYLGLFLINPEQQILAEILMTVIISVFFGFTYFHISNFKLMKKLREINTNLETIVEERTRELMITEKMATAGKFASMIGHDLRSPLQSIKNAVYVANNYPEENEKMMEIIGNSTDYASKILEDLRDLTRNTDPNKEEVILSDFISDTIQGYNTNNLISFKVNIDDNLETANFDPVKIRRVIDNLVKNSVEAIDETGEIVISTCCEDECLILKISDTGRGIPEESLGNIFQPFMTTKSKGLGLGLAYCKQAVEAHKGEITVESKLNKGTKFTIKLPLETVEI